MQIILLERCHHLTTELLYNVRVCGVPYILYKERVCVGGTVHMV